MASDWRTPNSLMLPANVKSAATRIVTTTVAVPTVSSLRARAQQGVGIDSMRQTLDRFGRCVTRSDRPPRDGPRPQRRPGVHRDADRTCDGRGDGGRRITGVAHRTGPPTRRDAHGDA